MSPGLIHGGGGVAAAVAVRVAVIQYVTSHTNLTLDLQTMARQFFAGGGCGLEHQ